MEGTSALNNKKEGMRMIKGEVVCVRDAGCRTQIAILSAHMGYGTAANLNSSYSFNSGVDPYVYINSDSLSMVLNRYTSNVSVFLKGQDMTTLASTTGIMIVHFNISLYRLAKLFNRAGVNDQCFKSLGISIFIPHFYQKGGEKEKRKNDSKKRKRERRERSFA